jgi:hypothetical protein
MYASNQHAYYCNPLYLPDLFMVSPQENEQEDDLGVEQGGYL